MENIVEITDFNAPELDVYARLTEAQLLNKDRPEDGIFIAESPKVIGRALPSVRGICENAERIAILENVMNPTNVGAVIRSAAALSMDAVLLTPGCSNPLYRRAIRVSMGTVFQIPWTILGDKEAGKWPEEGMAFLGRLGFRTAAMALRNESADIDDERLQQEKKLAVILGTEGDGLTDGTIERCDYTIKIPMSHGVDSLNVAAASAVAFWELGRRRPPCSV